MHHQPTDPLSRQRRPIKPRRHPKRLPVEETPESAELLRRLGVPPDYID